MTLLELSLKNCVRGEDVSSWSSANSGIRSIASKRFLGLLADPRPCTPRGAFIESTRHPGAARGQQPRLHSPQAVGSARAPAASVRVPGGGAHVSAACYFA